MADIRKWLFALAVVALLAGFTVPASAQIPTTPICSSQVATNYLARAEGYTEQVGDLIVTCTGGTPTSAGFPVPQADITVTMSQNVTSRITAATGSGTFLDALLIIDEPNSSLNPTIQILNCGAPGAPENTTLGSSGPGVCEIISAGPTAGNSSPSTYNGAQQTNTSSTCVSGTTALLGTPAAAGCTGHPNVFQGRQGQTANTVVFHGVPLDPPGTTTRILRFTNIRVNANGAGIAQANQTSLITMSIASAYAADRCSGSGSRDGSAQPQLRGHLHQQELRSVHQSGEGRVDSIARACVRRSGLRLIQLRWHSALDLRHQQRIRHPDGPIL